LQVPDPEMRSPRIGSSRARENRNSTALVKHNDSSETAKEIQARRIAKLFFLPPATANVLAELAFAGGER
jgi:hypothetical protein